MAEYTDLFCNSPETAEAVMRYLKEQLRQDEEAPVMDFYIEKATLRLIYQENDCRFREAIDAQLLGFRDGYEEGRKPQSPICSRGAVIGETLGIKP